jgi:valyl-tRNA synthetase
MEKRELDKVYNPADVEARWENFWLERGLFTASVSPEKPAFSMVIPPPNITGTLHLGHALNNTLQDILARYKRMTGYNVLWLPGIDHAGIATQNVVERQLKAEGVDRHAMGRDRFIERVWRWKGESGGAITAQLKRLGASCDWSRERFTMDEGLSHAVREVFVRLYNEGLVYRGDYIINWCPRCHTALSDLEVEQRDTEGKLYYFDYPLMDGPDFITVATTRPETMLGDTAVAVNPADERFSSFIGKTVILPIVEREIPVVADESVDMAFGTGAVKITPAHDFNDFETARRTNLPLVTVMDEDARMNENAGKMKGMDRFEAREAVIREFKERGLLRKTEPHAMMLGECYRCSTIVEPTLSKQWFVRAEPLAKEAVEAVKSGRTRFIPSSWENTYFDWMGRIRDWCISRQIWWGHRIPAWYCRDCDHITVAVKDPARCEACGSKELEQDFDVLDTWFSSALWPFSTLGWPEKTEELKTFYPTSALSTGFDIIFFWVARMMMMGIKFMGDVPFRDVYIHAMIRDAEGQKMSKSKGNVIDPLVMMDRFGTDAMRFTLAVLAAQGRDIKLSEDRIEVYRNFANKIWNLARFTLMNVEAAEPALPPDEKLSMADRWVLGRMSATAGSMRASLDAYSFDEAAKALYSFTWHELCDWYVELSKKDLWGDNGEERKKIAATVLLHALRSALKLLHPFMPFMTEELWSYLPGYADKSIMEEDLPEGGTSKTEPGMETVMKVIGAVRNLRTELNVKPGAPIERIVCITHPANASAINEGQAYIKDLARVVSVETNGAVPEGAVVSVVDGMDGPVEIHMPITGLIDVESETERLTKSLEKVVAEFDKLDQRLASESFVSKAPAEVVAKGRVQLAELGEKREKLEAAIERVKALG